MKRWLFLFLLLSSTLAADKVALFTPPAKWKIADPKTLGPRVEIGFLTKGKKGFCPSINLSSEPADLSLDQYVKVVMGLHRKKGTCRDYGSMHVKGGPARLIQIDTTSNFGSLRLMQLIAVWEGRAFVLTACAPKDDFGSYAPLFEKTFHSLTLTDDLHKLLDEKRQATLHASEARVIAAWQKYRGSVEFQKAWKPHEKMVINQFSDLGAHFQVLLLRQLKEKIKE